MYRYRNLRCRVRIHLFYRHATEHSDCPDRAWSTYLSKTPTEDDEEAILRLSPAVWGQNSTDPLAYFPICL